MKSSETNAKLFSARTFSRGPKTCCDWTWQKLPLVFKLILILSLVSENVNNKWLNRCRIQVKGNVRRKKDVKTKSAVNVWPFQKLQLQHHRETKNTPAHSYARIIYIHLFRAAPVCEPALAFDGDRVSVASVQLKSNTNTHAATGRTGTRGP